MRVVCTHASWGISHDRLAFLLGPTLKTTTSSAGRISPWMTTRAIQNLQPYQERTFGHDNDCNVGRFGDSDST